jgi:glycogen(starch) synthase
MRILTVGNGYPPHHHGGYELVWEAAVAHLRSRGHEVSVLTTDTLLEGVEADDDDADRSLRWHLVDGQFAELGPLAAAAMTRHNLRVMERKLEDLRPDVVGWWSMGGLSLVMLEKARRDGIPAAAFVHDEWLDYGRRFDPWLKLFTGPRRGRLAPGAERLTGMPTTVDFANAAHYAFVSEFTRSHAAGLGLGLQSTSVAHSGIHADFLEPAPERDWGWRLLYVGRIDPRKGIDTAIGTLPHLPAEAQLVIAGSWDQAEESRLRELAATLGVGDRVEFRGKLGREDLLAAYAETDVTVFPVRWDEPWGLVPLEAMGRGRPVIATGRGGSAEYLRDGENCLLFEADDEPALAAAVKRLAESPQLRARLRSGGFATAPRHTEDVFNRAVEAALTETAARADRRAAA